MKLVLTGGGTGGHIYPGLAIAEAIGADPAFAPFEVLFVGTRDRLEARIVPSAGVPIAFVRAAPLTRALSPRLVATLFANLAGFVQSLTILHRARPDFLIATGGYVSFPVVAALRLVRMLRRTRARIAVLEPNAAAGLTNRLLAPLADEMWYSIAPSRALAPRERVVGTPVRSSMRRVADVAAARVTLGLEPDATTVVVMGGSQGAASINDAVAALVLAGTLPHVQFAILAGARDYETLRARLAGAANVAVFPYLDDPRDAYAAADLVVARAGASTLGELAATGTPALLIPYPHATDDHQTHNARAYAATGAARVIADRELDATRLATELARALEPRTLATLRVAARDRAATDPRVTIVARVKALVAANMSAP